MAEPLETELVPRNEEILQHAGRLDGDNEAARRLYEEGMAAAFESCRRQLSDHGRFVVVFAHKALIELSRDDGAGDLRLLESLSNHVRSRGARPDRGALLPFGS